ncbi:hypothetical protein ABZ322_11060 [Streptomyces sp. NPDC006129]|uniref:hypothetical protein n=1 Tax=Streptomyces sp. NPDC006129 TaxID=3155348 RepID=UPI0033BF097C
MQIKARRSGSATAVVLDSALLAPDGNDGTFPDQARDLAKALDKQAQVRIPRHGCEVVIASG